MEATRPKYFQDGTTIRATRNRYYLAHLKRHVYLLHFCIQCGILDRFYDNTSIRESICFSDIQFFLRKIMCDGTRISIIFSHKLHTFDWNRIFCWRESTLTDVI